MALLLPDLEVLEQAHVEVRSRWVFHNIALGGAEGQAFRRGKCRRIEEQRPDHALNTGWNVGSGVGIADDIQIRTRSSSIAYAGIEKSVAETERECRSERW